MKQSKVVRRQEKHENERSGFPANRAKASHCGGKGPDENGQVGHVQKNVGERISLSERNQVIGKPEHRDRNEIPVALRIVDVRVETHRDHHPVPGIVEDQARPQPLGDRAAGAVEVNDQGPHREGENGRNRYQNQIPEKHSASADVGDGHHGSDRRDDRHNDPRGSHENGDDRQKPRQRPV